MTREDVDPAIAEVPAARWIRPCPLRDKDGRSLPLVWLLCFDPHVDSSAAFAKAGIARPAEVARSVVKRQTEFLCGRIVAREAMRRAGLAVWRSPVGTGPSREPLWPMGVSGSISHSTGLAACVVAPTMQHAALGVDIEQVAGGAALEAITQISVNEDERALLERCGGPDRMAFDITLAFSAKESLFKAAYAAVGRYFDFDAARVTALDAMARRLTLTLDIDLGGGYNRGRQCHAWYTEPVPGSVLTLCVP